MSLNQLSPGVSVREIDLTNFVPNVGVSGGAFVGQFTWGPVLDYTLISDSNRLAKVFGKPTDVNYADWYSVSNFLAYTNNCNVIRVVHDNAGVQTAFNAVARDSIVTGKHLTILNDSNFTSNYKTNTDPDFPLYNYTQYDAVFAAKYPGALGNSLRVIIADKYTFATMPDQYKWLFDFAPGTSEYAANLGGSDDEVHVVIIDDKGYFTNEPGAVLEKYSFLSKASDAKALDSSPMFFGSVINKTSTYVRYLGTFFDTAIVDPSGTTVASVAVDGATIGGTDYAVNDVITLTAPTGGGTVATAKVTAVDVDGVITAVALVTAGSGYNASQTVVATAITTTAGAGADLTKITAVLNAVTVSEWDRPVLDTSTGGGRKYAPLLALYDQEFLDGNDGGALDEGDLINGWNMFKDSEAVEVSLLFVGQAGGEAVVAGGTATVAETVINHVITNVAGFRKDCIMFFSPLKGDVVDQTQEAATENVVTFRNALETSSSYAVMDSGWKLMYDVYNDKYRWVPLNADTAGLCAATDMTFDPWWSPAGFTRGQVKGVVALAFNPNKAQRDVLYSANVNPVVSFKGEGVVLYGDRTLQAKASAFQYINVRRLFLVLEKSISRAAKYQLFEFNDAFTRAQFKNMIEPYLREVQGRRGIYDYKVVCDESNNTPEIIDRGEFVASIFIKPARSINFITLNFVAVRNGVEFSEVAGVGV